jgi:hypothetical protein
MKHLFFVVAVIVAAGCNKPAESDCRRAVQRIRELTGTAHEEAKQEVEAAVRSCRGNGTKESVQCAIEASSLEQLERCGLIDKKSLEELRAVETQSATPPATVDGGPTTTVSGTATAATDAGAPTTTGDAGAATPTTTGDAGAGAGTGTGTQPTAAPAGTVGGAAK